MTEWKPIATAPKDTIILLGTESDQYVDRHMFFVDIGWSYEDGFWSLTEDDIRFPSHWAPITSPIITAPITFYRRGLYRINGDRSDVKPDHPFYREAR
jgi:hypothetical protein